MLIAIALAVLFLAGVVIAVTPPAPIDRRSFDRRSLDPRSVRRLTIRLAAASASALLLVVLSGWVLPGLVVGAGVYVLVGGWQRRTRSSDAELARLDALATWIESVRDVLLAGEQPVGAIASSVAACPPVIRPEVRRLASGLGRQEPEIVFRRFADDLDDPVADLVAAGLAIAIRRGARTVPVLTSLAEQTRQQADRRRLVEAERAPTRREVQALTAIMSGLVILLLVFGRSQYLAAYDTPAGQAFLALMLALYGGLLMRVQQLAAFPRPNRFLSAHAYRTSP